MIVSEEWRFFSQFPKQPRVYPLQRKTETQPNDYVYTGIYEMILAAQQ